MAQPSLRQQIQNDQRSYASFTTCEQVYTRREIRAATASTISVSLKSNGSLRSSASKIEKR